MHRHEIRQVVLDYLTLLETGETTAEENFRTLEITVDRLGLAYHFSDSGSDQTDYPDPPVPDYTHFRALAVARFPDFGFYNLPSVIADRIAEAEWHVGDAIDDLADIARDLWEVRWAWENTSEEDAMWHFRFLYEAHWGDHLRNLQRYLHAFKNES